MRPPLGASDYDKMLRSIYSTIYPPSFVTDIPKPEPPPALAKEFVAGPTLGYRRWLVVGDELKSTGVEHVWQPGVPTVAKNVGASSIFSFSARCDGTACPHQGHSCGIHAVRRFEDVPAYEGRGVLGQVGMWGKVIEHEKGYRAQYAYPVALYVPAPPSVPLPIGFPSSTRWMDALHRLADRYGVPLVSAPEAQRSEGANP